MKKLFFAAAILATTTVSFGQIIIPATGNVGFGTTTPLAKLDVSVELPAKGTYNSQIWSNGNPDFNLRLNTIWNNENINQEFTQRFNGIDYKSLAFYWGNIGIGTTKPTAKLELTGGGVTTALSNINSTLTQRLNTANPDVSLGMGNVNSENPFIQAYNNSSLTSNRLILNPFGGNVGIGSQNPDEKLTVKGKIHSEEVIVDLLVPADYVFEKYYTGASTLKADYEMPSLAEVETYTKANNHLPNVPSAQEIKDKGLQLGEMSNLLLQKVEELTLYIIEQNKKIQALEAKVNGK
jgi:hypothetical protein